MERDLVDGSRRARARLRERLPRAWRAEGRQRRAPRPQQPRLGARRLRARADRRRGHPGLCVELGARRRLPPLALGGRGDRLRGRDTAREGRGGLGRAAVAAARAHVPRPRRPRDARTRLRGHEPRRTRRRHFSDRRGGPLHDHLHLGHDRPTQGLHALESQLPRDGDRRRPDGGDVLPPGRRHAPLPPPRPQLRAADAAARGARRLHDRVPRRPAAGGGGAAAGPPDAPAERSARVREGAHGRAGEVRRRDGRQATLDRLGAPDRARGEPARERGRARAGRAAPQAPDRRPPRLQQGARALRRPPAHAWIRWCAAVEGDHRVLRRRGHPHHRGVRADGVHHGGEHEPAGRLPLRLRRSATARLRGAHRRRRRDRGALGDRLPGLLQGRRRRRPPCSGRTAGSRPETSATSTRTASSTSPTARRTSS